MAIDGDVIVVGAPIAQKFAFPLRDGAAYVFQHNGTAWVETDALRAADGYSEEGFGDAVAVSGNRVLIGAPSDANDNGADAGAFYFYETTPPPPSSPFTVTTTADAGPGSLRAALTAANAVSVITEPNPIEITFDIAGPGTHTISPTSALPQITRPVLIDGFSQPGSAPNTAAIDEAIDAVVLIELSGASTTGAGLQLGAGSGGSTIRGLAINGFSFTAIAISGDGDQTIAGNHIGVEPDGSPGVSSQSEGVLVLSSGNLIGGVDPADRNLISGNANAGIWLAGAAASLNLIRGNFIGTDPTGTIAVPNGSGGVWISGVDNTVGGTDVTDRNLISGNGRGVLVYLSSAVGNEIQGNWIGTDVTGTLPLPNESGIPFDPAGIAVQQGAIDTLIGGTTAGAGNLIASNDPTGVFVSGVATTGTSILGNSITGSAGLGINVLDQVLPVPVITELDFDGVDLTVSGTLTAAIDDYRVEVFANDLCDASGFGEGQYFLGSIDVAAGDFDAGTASFATVIAAPTERSNVTATATSSAGSTSTFGACVDTTTMTATFTNAAGGNSWTTPGNWNTGVVPGPSDAAVIPAGPGVVIAASDDVEIGSLTADGEVRVEGTLTIIDDSTANGLFDVITGGRLVLDSVLTVGPSGQLFVDEGVGTPGLIEARDGAGFAGAGLVANSGIVVFTGSGVIPVGPGLTWNSGVNSLTDITGGTVDVQTDAFDARGIISVAPGAVLRAQDGFTMAATSSLEFFVDGPASDDANYGRLEVQGGSFTANGTVVTTPVGGYLPTGDTYPLITCATGGCLGGTFDVFFGGRIDGRTANEITFVLVNTYTGPATSLAPGNWATPFAWNFGVVPGATDEAAIPAGRFVRMAAPGPIRVGSLTVAGDLSVLPLPVTNTANPGVRVEINGDSVVTSSGRLFVGGSTDCTVDGVVTVVPGFPDDECVASVTTLQLSADLRVDGNLSAATQVLSYGVYQITSNPVVELDGGASLSGSGTVFLSADVAKSDAGTVTIGPDLDVNLVYGAGNDTRGVLEVTGGTLDIQSAPPSGSFTADGTIEVGPGAIVSIADDLTLGASSVLEFGIDGPSSSVVNSGRIELPTGSLTANGTFRASLVGGYEPDSDDLYALIECTAGDCAGGTFTNVEVGDLEFAQSTSSISLAGGDPSLALAISPSNPTPAVGVGTIALSDLPATVFQGYGGTTSDYATSDLKTLDLRADLGAPNAASTPVAAVTLDELGLDGAPITRRLLNTILLPEIPIEGGWSRALRPNTTELLVEQTISLLDVYQESASGGRYPGAAERIELGDLALQASNLGSISTFAALLAGAPVEQLPFPAGANSAIDYWCGQVDAAGLDCLADFGVNPSTGAGGANLTLPVLSFAGIDIEQADLLGTPLVRPNADGTGDVVVNLAGTPIGDQFLGSLNLGVVPLASQPLVPSKSLPSFVPVTPQIPAAFENITLGELAGATPLGALTPADLGLSGVLLSTGNRPVPQGESALDLDHRADSPLSDYQWVQPAPGAGLLLASEAALSPAVSGVKVSNLGTDAPLLSVPLDELILPDGRALGDVRLSELLAETAPFGASPFGASPFGASPFGASPFGAVRLVPVPFGASPFGASPFGASPFGASPFGASPFGASPFGASPFGASPFGRQPVWCVAVWRQPVWCQPVRRQPVWCFPVRRQPVWCFPVWRQSVWCVAVWCQPVRRQSFRRISVWCVAVWCEPVRCVAVVRTRALSSHCCRPARWRRRQQAAGLV